MNHANIIRLPSLSTHRSEHVTENKTENKIATATSGRVASGGGELRRTR